MLAVWHETGIRGEFDSASSNRFGMANKSLGKHKLGYQSAMPMPPTKSPKIRKWVAIIDDEDYVNIGG
jgi:hypothetical protein